MKKKRNSRAMIVGFVALIFFGLVLLVIAVRGGGDDVVGGEVTEIVVQQDGQTITVGRNGRVVYIVVPPHEVKYPWRMINPFCAIIAPWILKSLGTSRAK